jgi:hypothetical protein
MGNTPLSYYEGIQIFFDMFPAFPAGKTDDSQKNSTISIPVGACRFIANSAQNIALFALNFEKNHAIIQAVSERFPVA